MGSASMAGLKWLPELLNNGEHPLDPIWMKQNTMGSA